MKCGPDDCPIIAFSDLTPAEQRVERKRIAKRMSDQGFTEQQIAKQLGVSKSTISTDLADFPETGKLKPAKTATNPKGAGRPKGSKPRKVAPDTPQTDRAYEEIIKAQSEGRKLPPKKELAKAIGISHMAVEKAWDRVHQERGQAATVTAAEDRALAEASFSDKGKIKIDDAIRIHKARLDKQFEQRVRDEVRRQINVADDATRAENKRLRQENLNLTRIVNQRGVFTEIQYRHMLMLCHPDSSASQKLKADLLHLLVENKKRLIKSEPERVAA